MVISEPKSAHLREVLLFAFNWKKSATEAHRMLEEVHGDHALSKSHCSVPSVDVESNVVIERSCLHSQDEVTPATDFRIDESVDAESNVVIERSCLHSQDEVTPATCMDIKNVRKWCREFNEGRINVHDEQRSGRPSLPESTVNRRITLEEIEDGLNEDCSHFSVHKIVSETLGYRKVSARWVDKWLKEAAGEWYNTGITKLVDRMKKVIEHQGDYVEK
ncbi:hypothetical protein LAZ67_1001556 [Cordylochernes scorpioides]|uniref:Mos1 transposase HTH domain-containing protein n=1 Tax=Cordylochernes scorpioides TaxID=51811 RepID=A0ABY6K071_9ARAC|nr:hypothetical protein LAZ67_1001556 [Cordylochernes scorpioides]